MHVHFAYDPYTLNISDLNNDGDIEFIVSGFIREQRVTAVLNRQFDLLALLKENILVDENGVLNTGFGRKKLLLARGEFGSYFLSFEKQFPLSRSIQIKMIHFLGIVMFLFVFTSIMIFHYRSLRFKNRKDILYSINYGVMTLNPKGKILFVNDQIGKLLEIKTKSAIGRSYKEVFAPTHFEELVRTIGESFQVDKPSFEKELTIQMDDRRTSFIVTINEIAEKSGACEKIILVQDITGIVHSKRAVAWASMAQRLAHEIKTPLSTVMLSAQRLQTECDKKSEKSKDVKKYIERIIGQVDRLRKMTDAFLKFSNIEKPRIERLDINQKISECLQENRLKIGSEMKIVTAFSDNLPPHLRG